MNLTERGNYMIALLISLAFHFFILFLFMPGYMTSKPTSLETFPVGLVEIAAGEPDGSNGMMGSLPEETVPVPPAAINKPRGEQPDKGKMVVKPNVNPKQPPEDAIVLPKKEGIAIAEEPGKKPAHGGIPTGGAEGTGDTGTSSTGKPMGFGSGEGMVTVLGPLPPYPKNAMNEGKEGEVTVRVLVMADGSLEQVIITKTSGDSRLDKAADSAIRRTWKFKPVTKDYYIDLVFSFSIRSGVTLKFLNSENRP
jgi:TonB family protein